MERWKALFFLYTFHSSASVSLFTDGPGHVASCSYLKPRPGRRPAKRPRFRVTQSPRLRWRIIFFVRPFSLSLSSVGCSFTGLFGLCFSSGFFVLSANPSHLARVFGTLSFSLDCLRVPVRQLECENERGSEREREREKNIALDPNVWVRYVLAVQIQFVYQRDVLAINFQAELSISLRFDPKKMFNLTLFLFRVFLVSSLFSTLFNNLAHLNNAHFSLFFSLFFL